MQVNAGVGEVAKVFLTISNGSRDRMSSDWNSKKSEDSTVTAVSPSESKALEDNNELTVKLKVSIELSIVKQSVSPLLTLHLHHLS